MRVLVTGATGFVGRALTAELVARGMETVTVGGPGNSHAEYSANVADNEEVRRLENVGVVDAVVHAAGIAHRFGRVTDEEYQRVNVDGVANAAELAVRLGATHFLLLSSTLVYGKGGDRTPIMEDHACAPIDAYGRSKLEGENAARRVCEAANIALTIFRPAPIMGEGSKGNFARLIRAIDHGRFVWVGPGENLKSVVYVRDVANAAAEVLAKGGAGTQVFNVAADAVKMKDIVNTIAASLGRKKPSFHLPATPVKLAAGAASILGGRFGQMSRMVDTWLGDDVYSNERLQAAYGVKPATPLATAVKREVEYYLKHK